jgi:hypothetical protein
MTTALISLAKLVNSLDPCSNRVVEANSDIIKDINDYVCITEEIYWKALKENDTAILYSDKYLLKDEFVFDPMSTNDKNLKELFEYVEKESNITIAGGYPTLYFLNKYINGYPYSDIDIYIMNKKNQKETCKDLLLFLDNKYGIDKFLTYTDIEMGVFNVKCKSIDRTIQIIGTCANTPAEILSQYDCAHNKCCVYMGNTYITIDAHYAKCHKTTMFYKAPGRYRFIKAKLLGLKIFNFPEIKSNDSSSDEESLNKSSSDEESSSDGDSYSISIGNTSYDEIYTYKSMIKKNKQKFCFQRTLNGILRDFTPVKQWCDEYKNQMSSYLDVKLPFKERYDSTLAKYYNLLNFCDFENFVKFDIDTFKFPNQFKKDYMDKNSESSSRLLYYIFQNFYQMFTTNVIKLKGYHMYSKDSAYYYNKMDTQIRIPIGKEFGDESTEQLLFAIDKKCESNFNQLFKNHFPKDKMQYTPIVRQYESDNSDYSYNRFKAVFKHYYDKDNDQYVLDVDVIKNGECINIKSADELRDLLTPGTKIKCECYFKYFWIFKTIMHYNRHSRERPCGSTIICKKITIVDDTTDTTSNTANTTDTTSNTTDTTSTKPEGLSAIR